MSKQSDLVSVSQGASGDPLFIDTANDRVGIGATTLDAPLTIKNPSVSGDQNILTVQNGAGTGAVAKVVYNQSDDSLKIINASTYAGSHMDFWTNNTERMRIDSSGNVGIGTSSPTLNTNGTVLHINDSGAARAAIAHFTTAASGSGAADGLIVGKWSDGTNYIFDYDSNPIVFGVNSGEAGRFDTSRNLLVGTTSFSYAYNGTNSIQLSGPTIIRTVTSTSDTNAIVFNNPNGQVGYINTSGSSTVYATSSDYRLKEDVQPMTGASDRVLALNPVNFAWKVDGSRVDGFLAHEAQAVVPEAVSGTKDQVDDEGNPVYQGIDQSKLVPLLTAALQEALSEIQDLKARVATLEGGAA